MRTRTLDDTKNTDRWRLAAATLVCAFVVVGVGTTANAADRITLDATGQTSAATAAVQAAVDTFEAQYGSNMCWNDLTIGFKNLDGMRSAYVLGKDHIDVNPNRPASGMQRSVEHEIGHHVTITCGLTNNPDFTDYYYKATGLPTTRTWFDYSDGWSKTPAEWVAESFYTLLTGSKSDRIPGSSQGVGLVEDALARRPLELPAGTLSPLVLTSKSPAVAQLTPPPTSVAFAASTLHTVDVPDRSAASVRPAERSSKVSCLIEQGSRSTDCVRHGGFTMGEYLEVTTKLRSTAYVARTGGMSEASGKSVWKTTSPSASTRTRYALRSGMGQDASNTPSETSSSNGSDGTSITHHIPHHVTKHRRLRVSVQGHTQISPT